MRVPVYNALPSQDIVIYLTKTWMALSQGITATFFQIMLRGGYLWFRKTLTRIVVVWGSHPMNPLKELAQRGLYSPHTEHDSCGVGMVANIRGGKTHQIITESLQVLVNLGHRGACGCDPETGDGAGILIQMPHEFLQQQCAGLGISLPAPGKYGVGMVFLPPNGSARVKCENVIEQVVRDEGLEFLGWRDVPVDPDKLGRDARAVKPCIRQMFVGSGPQSRTSDE